MRSALCPGLAFSMTSSSLGAWWVAGVPAGSGRGTPVTSCRCWTGNNFHPQDQGELTRGSDNGSWIIILFRKRSYSLVRVLDTTQTRENSSRPHEPPPPDLRPRDLHKLNSLQEAIPVARAAARFRSSLDHDQGNGHQRGGGEGGRQHRHVSKESLGEEGHRHRGRLRRKSHSLY